MSKLQFWDPCLQRCFLLYYLVHRKDRWLTSEEEKNLFSHLKGRLFDIVKLVLNTGLRQDEVFSLPRSNVDLFRKTVTVKGKGDKVRTNPLNAAALGILKTRVKTRPIHSELVFPSAAGTKIMRQRLVRAFSKAVKDSGLQDFHFHDLRHYAEFQIMPSCNRVSYNILDISYS
ncbi:MAG TPA: hypothetical protein DCP92_03005 [Nitrospiraceae bacterium]|nr:hypothetical protein [Nitrospiraceae bacterium]